MNRRVIESPECLRSGFCMCKRSAKLNTDRLCVRLFLWTYNLLWQSLPVKRAMNLNHISEHDGKNPWVRADPLYQRSSFLPLHVITQPLVLWLVPAQTPLPDAAVLEFHRVKVIPLGYVVPSVEMSHRHRDFRSKKPKISMLCADKYSFLRTSHKRFLLLYREAAYSLILSCLSYSFIATQTSWHPVALLAFPLLVLFFMYGQV